MQQCFRKMAPDGYVVDTARGPSLALGPCRSEDTVFMCVAVAYVSTEWLSRRVHLSRGVIQVGGSLMPVSTSRAAFRWIIDSSHRKRPAMPHPVTDSTLT